MFSRSPGFATVAAMLMLLGTRMEAAPAWEGQEEDFARPPPHPPSHTRASVLLERSLPSNPNQYLKSWRLSTGVDGPTGVVDRAAATRSRSGWLKAESGATVPDKREQMLKMITALEALQRTFEGTLSSRITIVPRAGGRNPGRKHKMLAAADGDVKPSTVAPVAADSTSSRTSTTDDTVPSLTGRTFKKSLLSQNKKTNKRVCFWKYCSQN